ncbi:MAG: ABC transporter ATP-binding protein [Limnohabitans sp.]|nr:ABC transporter ATP-binding protein [Limnohabitans sp.]
MPTPLLSLKGMTKRYPSVVACNVVSLDVQHGEIHAVLGENGAGKSTLMKMIYGSVQPDAGSIEFLGQTVLINNPQEARRLGINMVFQHFNLFDTLTVAQNVWLGLDQSFDLQTVSQKIIQKASAYRLDIDPQRPVHTLSVGEMQRVEIIRALLSDPKLLILDEPTSVLTPQAVDKLFTVLRQLVLEGCSIVYISHKLHEIRALCHRCTVMRAGRVTGVCDPRQETNQTLSQMMLGAQPVHLVKRDSAPQQVVLQVNQLQLKHEDQFGVDLKDITFQVRRGEVVGIAGVSGNGQRELLYALSGEDTRSPHVSIAIEGQSVGAWGPQQRRRLGLHFVPDERLGRGAVPSMSLAHNLLLTRTNDVHASGWIQWKQLQQNAQRIIDQFQVKAQGPLAQAQSLSGGNLQKFIVGREIDAKPHLLIVSQPTWGVDVGAAAQIRSAILQLRDAGCAVLIISEELEELFELSDRIHVMAEGRLSPSMNRTDANVQTIGTWMSGLWDRSKELSA